MIDKLFDLYMCDDGGHSDHDLFVILVAIYGSMCGANWLEGYENDD